MKPWLIALSITAGLSAFAPMAQAQYRNDGVNDNDRSAERNRAVRAARGEVDRANALLRASVERVRASWDANPQMIDAEKSLEEANASFEAKRKAIVDKLQSDPAYKDSLAKARSANQDVRAEQKATNEAAPPATQPVSSDEPAVAVPPPPTQAQVDAALEKLNKKSELRDMEEAAIEKDPEARAARDARDAARDKVALMQKQLDAALLNDPDYKSAQEQLATAKANVARAGATY